MASYNAMREKQKQEDISSKVREKGGRQIISIPEDFLYITRVIGLLRGLCVDLDCDCPILFILALHAKAGLYN
ncbi:hypothetical protein EON65_18205 [archaeon]|nr:MAG: hypothetical protein EON65_18205 [archaeon]